MAKLKKLLFVDTNIWLDFYRTRNSDVGLKRLEHLESLSESIIVTHVLEMEYKKGRQSAIAEGLKQLNPPTPLARLGIFSDARAAQMITKNYRTAGSRVKTLRARLIKALEKPTLHDPVYKACQRIFHRNSDLVLDRESKQRFAIRRRAIKRFYLGCPPRKQGDTSIGDAVNWEWMVECAIQKKAELIIVTRDSDFGAEIEGQMYLNDHLKQEFSERVSKKRTAHLCRLLTDALKLFNVKVSQEEAAEEKLISSSPSGEGGDVLAVLGQSLGDKVGSVDYKKLAMNMDVWMKAFSAENARIREDLQKSLTVWAGKQTPPKA